jgi:orotate phosphoribosyltransferase
MQAFQRDFIDLLVRHEVLRFGDFTLKSGRRSPYFVNAGQLRTGHALAGLGRAYAACLASAEINADMIFGPSYKGVPLAVATAAASASAGPDVGFCFDRKEPKAHGEGGRFVGMQPRAGMRVVIVDDVITSGRSIREAAALLRDAADIELVGVIVAVDRQERAKNTTKDQSTLAALREQLAAPVHAIVTIREVVTALHGRRVTNADGQTSVVIDDEQRDAIEAYLAEHACL